MSVMTMDSEILSKRHKVRHTWSSKERQETTKRAIGMTSVNLREKPKG